MERPILLSSCAKKSQTNNTIVDSNAGHLNNRPVHDMVLLLLHSGENSNYTGWLADWLHWFLLTAAICNGCCYLQWYYCLQLLPSAMAAGICNCCLLQWLLLSAMAATICNCCFWKLWIHWSGSGSPGFTAGLPVEICQTSICSNSCGHGTNKCNKMSI